eukprot:TRINITY_DN30869_c0_g1_i1.p1 TRINITY_DN30869_c0_g1~~TRINITY_DN30869_c0_g1_i1.p1  ORF type:complete len:1177 (-),score=275.72 TRINITY_DN30869_c0_g1_i1:94-3378(-)
MEAAEKEKQQADKKKEPVSPEKPAGAALSETGSSPLPTRGGNQPEDDGDEDRKQERKRSKSRKHRSSREEESSPADWGIATPSTGAPSPCSDRQAGTAANEHGSEARHRKHKKEKRERSSSRKHSDWQGGEGPPDFSFAASPAGIDVLSPDQRMGAAGAYAAGYPAYNQEGFGLGRPEDPQADLGWSFTQAQAAPASPAISAACSRAAGAAPVWSPQDRPGWAQPPAPPQAMQGIAVGRSRSSRPGQQVDLSWAMAACRPAVQPHLQQVLAALTPKSKRRQEPLLDVSWVLPATRTAAGAPNPSDFSQAACGLSFEDPLIWSGNGRAVDVRLDQLEGQSQKRSIEEAATAAANAAAKEAATAAANAAANAAFARAEEDAKRRDEVVEKLAKELRQRNQEASGEAKRREDLVEKLAQEIRELKAHIADSSKLSGMGADPAAFRSQTSGGSFYGAASGFGSSVACNGDGWARLGGGCQSFTSFSGACNGCGSHESFERAGPAAAAPTSPASCGSRCRGSCACSAGDGHFCGSAEGPGAPELPVAKGNPPAALVAASEADVPEGDSSKHKKKKKERKASKRQDSEDAAATAASPQSASRGGSSGPAAWPSSPAGGCGFPGPVPADWSSSPAGGCSFPGPVPEVLSEGSWEADPDRLERYKAVFYQTDEDGDGFVTANEVRQLLERASLEEAEMAQIWGLSDQDQDGRLSLGEFVVAMHLTFRRSKEGVQLPGQVPAVLDAQARQAEEEEIAWELGAEELAGYRDIFQSLDATGSGFVGAAEGRELFERSQLEVAELSQIWQMSDLDGDGLLALPEFLCAMIIVARRRQGLALPAEVPPRLLQRLQLMEPPTPQHSGWAGDSSEFPAPQQEAEAAPPPAQPNGWVAGAQELDMYRQLFLQSDPEGTGVADSNQVKALMEQSQLPTSELSTIFAVADMDRDGQLKQSEFLCAMALVARRRQGAPIPSEVPPELLQVCLVGDAALPPAEATAPQQAVAASPWALASGEAERYQQLFWEVSSGGQSIGPDAAREVLETSELPVDDLAMIWDLADHNDNGELSLGEFTCAMVLAARRRQGFPLPNALPFELQHLVQVFPSGR